MASSYPSKTQQFQKSDQKLKVIVETEVIEIDDDDDDNTNKPEDKSTTNIDANTNNNIVKTEVVNTSTSNVEDEGDDEDAGEEMDKDAEEEEHDTTEQSVAEDDSSEINIDELLKSKIKLSDGTENYIFSRGPKYSDKCWPINCHLCRVGNLILTRQLRAHLRGNMHKTRLTGNPPDAQKYVDPFRQPFGNYEEITTPMKIYPGEIITEITDQYKDRILEKREFPFQTVQDDRLLKILNIDPLYDYNKKFPIIGMEYFFKMKRGDKVKYYCALCHMDVFGEAYQHIVGAAHQLKYIEKHFPKMLQQVEKLLQKTATLPFNVKQKYIRCIFRKLYRKLENIKGIRFMQLVKWGPFRRNLNLYVRRCRDKINHYNENTIKFTDEEVLVLVEKLCRGRSVIQPDVISLLHPHEGYRDDGVDDYRNRSGRKRGRSPIKYRDLPNKSSRRERFEDNPKDWERYRVMIGEILDNLDQVYENYENNPESHPMYKEEWRIFWRRRSAELERDNIDPRYYDFNKEWIPYWTRRLEEFHSKDVAKRKFEMKRTLHLAYDKRSPSPIRRRRPRQMRRSPTPTSTSSHNIRNNRYPEQMREDAPPDVVPQQEPLSLISVLRLLTALEDVLGSLGPKAVQLLGRAVLVEKNKQNPNELMMESEYYLFFVTAKEKLTGQLIANIIEPSKSHAVQRVTFDLSRILQMFEEFVSRQGGRLPRPTTNVMRMDNMSQNQYDNEMNPNGMNMNKSDGDIQRNTNSNIGGNLSNNNNNRMGMMGRQSQASSNHNSGNRGGDWRGRNDSGYSYGNSNNQMNQGMSSYRDNSDSNIIPGIVSYNNSGRMDMNNYPNDNYNDNRNNIGMGMIGGNSSYPSMNTQSSRGMNFQPSNTYMNSGMTGMMPMGNKQGYQGYNMQNQMNTGYNNRAMGNNGNMNRRH